MSWQIKQADVLKWAAGYEGESFHACLCDPPYSLGDGKRGFMNRDWDNDISFNPATWAAIAEHLHPGGFIMAFGGSRTYHRLACAVEDAGLIIHPSLIWLNGQGFPKATRIDTQIDKVAGRVGESIIELKHEIRKRYEATGLTLQEFNGACGFEASGYLRELSTWANVLPSREKWQRIKEVTGCDGSLDSLFDEAEREVIGKSEWSHQMGIPLPNEYDGQRQHLDITAPATPLAATWAGHRYGLQALKPCAEFILAAQKPYEGKPVESIVSTGAGALNIDQARVGYQSDNDRPHYGAIGGGGWSGDLDRIADFAGSPNQDVSHPSGRWPPNVCLTHAEGCVRVGTRRVRGISGGYTEGSSGAFGGHGIYSKTEGTSQTIHYADPDGLETVEAWECEPQCPVRLLGEQSGESKSTGGTAGHSNHFKLTNGDRSISANVGGLGDTGTAARFYPQHDWSYEIAERLAGVTPFRYVAKAARGERDAGLDRFPIAQAEHNTTTNYCGRCDKRVNSNGSGVKCECGDKRITEHRTTARNPHPTVKPITLARWLATLLLPPPEYAPRRIMIPFGGVMSEAIGAILAGWDEVVAIEMEEEYIPIGEARLRFWSGWAERGYDDPKAILKAAKKEEKRREKAQMELSF